MSEAILAGYHFTPTEEELIHVLMAFLECKAQGMQFPSSPVAEKILYGENATPWEIFGEDDAWESAELGDAGKKGVKEVVYVLTQLSALSAKKIARTAGCGTWDGQTGIKEVENRKGQIIGVRKMLSFRVKGDSESQQQEKGQWRMHEYALSGVSLEEMAMKKIDIGHYVICKITRDYSKCENPTKDQILGKRKSDFGAETSHKNKKYRTLMELANYEAERIISQEGQIYDQQVTVSSSEHWADHTYEGQIYDQQVAVSSSEHWADHTYDQIYEAERIKSQEGQIYGQQVTVSSSEHWADHTYDQIYQAERIKSQEGQIYDQQVMVSSSEHWADHTYDAAAAETTSKPEDEDDDMKRHLEWFASCVDLDLDMGGLLNEMKEPISWNSLVPVL